jgi:3',5'-cyclic AMP phosphodiesterase CpdA
MRTLVHLSDLHFGRVDHALLEPLTARVKQLRPDLVVVSGDLTQRARSAQFVEARHFLDTLPSPQIVVPGNHDVPLYNLFQRFVQPRHKFRRYVTSDLEPAYFDDEIAVVGINTTRSFAFKGGRINNAQVERVRARLCDLDQRVTKIIVSHHPFDLPADRSRHELVGRAAAAMQTFARCGVHLLLAGHFHVSHAGDTSARYKLGDFSALVVQAGTATSTRSRGESNSFNALIINPARVRIERFTWNPAVRDFALTNAEEYDHTPSGWSVMTGGEQPAR